MKKFKYLICAATFAALVSFTVPAGAQTPISENFIGGGGSGPIAGFNGYLQINSGQELVFGTNNFIYAKGSFITNLLTTITNPANSLIITGYVSQLFPNWVSNSSGISDQPLWANRDGSAPICSISVDINGNGEWATNGTGGNAGNVGFTNALTFVFNPIYGGPGAVNGAGGPAMGGTSVATSPGFQFTISGNGTNDVYYSTNVPQNFLQGAKALRLQTITSTSAALATNGQIVGVWLNGFLPGQNQ